MKLGFIINPIAGMGGKVGLKGTDGREILEEARRRGASPEAPVKAKKALEMLLPLKDKLLILSCPGDMGENQLEEMGFSYELIGEKKEITSSQDTEVAAKTMLEEEVDLILFAGGDGTARNIYNAIGDSLPVLGIPAGVKIHSAVYALHPRSAGEVVYRFFTGGGLEMRESEVMDIDEEAFRDGRLSAKLYGYMKVPFERSLVQSLKSGRPQDESEALQGIAQRLDEQMEEGVYYLVGSGTSIRPLMDRLGLENTLLGIDLIKDRKLVGQDLREEEILELIGDSPTKVIVTIIGGQGYIFGRGNQQISARVLRKVGKDNVIVLATKDKLVSLEGRPLLVDLGDEELNKAFTGYRRIITGFNETGVYRTQGLV